MITESTWVELEAEVDTRQGSFWRRVLPDSEHEIFIGLLMPQRSRQLSVRGPASVGDHPMEQTRIVEAELGAPDSRGEREFLIRLQSKDASGVFTALVNDLVRHLDQCKSRSRGLSEVINRFVLWKRLLSPKGPLGLTFSEQQGLFGELQLLHDVVEETGNTEIVSCWYGPDSARCDFVNSGYALEIKTVAESSYPRVRIASEHQLSARGLTALHLCIYVVSIQDSGNGKSLPDLVQEMRGVLGGSARDIFEDKLIQVGYADVHSPRYESRKYSLRSRQIYEVDQFFPALTPESIPLGVGAVDYEVSLDTCSANLRESHGVSRFLMMDTYE